MEREEDFNAAYGYIARDEDNRVFFYAKEPTRSPGGTWRVSNGDSATYLGVDVFPEVKPMEKKARRVRITLI